MGNFYTSITLRGASLQKAVEVMKDLRRDAYVFGDGNVVVVYDRESEEQDTEVLAALAEKVATETESTALAVLDHDDDVLWFQVYDRDRLVAEYCNRAAHAPASSRWQRRSAVRRRGFVSGSF